MNQDKQEQLPPGEAPASPDRDQHEGAPEGGQPEEDHAEGDQADGDGDQAEGDGGQPEGEETKQGSLVVPGQPLLQTTPSGGQTKKRARREYKPLDAPPFSQKCLQVDAKPSEFFNELSYKIDLEQLYKVHDVQYFSAESQRDYFVLILQVINEELKDKIEAPYLMQTWKQGVKINEIKFENPPRLWGFDNNYLYYQEHDGEKDKDKLILRRLEDTEQLQIPNVCGEVTYTYIAYMERPEMLVLANEEEIKIICAGRDEFPGGECHGDRLTIQTVKPQLKLKGIYTPYFVFETEDHQLDFNLMEMYKSGDEVIYEFVQQAEAIPRECKNDPITKIVSYEVKAEPDNLVYTIGLRRSGNFDLYYNCIRQYSSKNKVCEDITITSSTLYFKIREKNKKGDQVLKNYTIDHNHTASLNFDMAVGTTAFDFRVIKNMIAKDFINLYINFAITSYGTTTQAIVAHDHFLSCFDMVSNKWFTHLMFEERITQFYHKYRVDNDEEFFYAMLANGELKHFSMVAFDEEYYDGTFSIDRRDNEGGKIKGEIKCIYEDQQQHKYSLILAQDGERTKLYLAINDYVVKINRFLKEKVLASSKFVILQGLPEEQNAFLHITDKDIIKYEMTFKGKPKTEKEPEENKLGILGEEKKQEDEDQEPDFSDDGNGDAQDMVENLLNITTNPKHSVKNFRATCQEQTKLKIGEIHDALFYQEDQGKNIHYILSDQTNLFVFKEQNKTFYVKKETYIMNLVHFSMEDNYVLKKGLSKQEQGLYYYNMNDVIKKVNEDALKTLSFTKINVGLNSALYYNIGEDRVGYFNSVSKITVIPLLHINFVKFLGISSPEQYLAYKVHRDKFTALHQSGKLQTWSLISGKLLFQKQLDDIDFSGFKNYSSLEEDEMIKRDKALLISEEQVYDTQLSDYFQEHQLMSNLDHQQTFIQQQAQTIHHFKYIEIVNEQKVELLFEFYHPNYDYQFLYFSNQKKEPFLIERLNFEKVNLFKAKHQQEKFIKWEIVRRIDDFDAGFEGKVRDFLPFYSPDFTYHISLNRKEKTFQIKETISNIVVANIPQDILEFSDKSKPVNAINRVQFLDNETLRVVNLEGIEKIVLFQRDFQIEEYNTIPFFVDIDLREGFENSPYFFEREAYPLHGTEEWLARKMQQYKSSYNLFHRTDKLDLQQVMYTVEREYMQYASLSFTYLHWSLMEQVGNGQINVSDINENQLQSMLYNIIPGGNTCLHLFAYNDQPDDLLEVYKLSQPNPSNLQEIVYFTPIIKNFNGHSALHVAMERKDFKSTDLMLKYLKGYGIDNHSRELVDLIPQFIEKGLPESGPYLESRMLQNQQIKKLSKARLLENYPEIEPIQLWYADSTFKNTYLDSNAEQIEKRIQCHFIDLPDAYHYNHPNFQDYFNALAGTDNFDYFSIKSVQKLIEFNFPLTRTYTIKKLLIPYILFQLVFVVYFNAFMETFIDMREYRDIYNNEDSFIMTADFKDQLHDLYRMSEDVLAQVTVGDNLIGYEVTPEGSSSQVLLTNLMDEGFKQSGLVTLTFSTLLVLFATYFFWNELNQMIDNGVLDYLSQIWNYIDILPPIGIYISITLLLLNLPNAGALERTVQAITTFFMWFKLLYFMRIFSNTGYLIRMIIVVISDMRAFLLVLLIGLIAFGSTFLCIARANQSIEGATVFTDSLVDSIIYVYNIILGGFDTGEYENSIAYGLVMTLFILCTIFNMIVMLNLLIAIISESFANVNSNAKQAMFQEMASLVAENNYLIPDSQKKSYAAENQHLLVITDLEAVDSEFSDPVITSVNETKDEMLADISQFRSDLQAFNQMHQKLSNDIQTEQAEFKKNMQAFFKMIEAGGD